MALILNMEKLPEMQVTGNEVRYCNNCGIAVPDNYSIPFRDGTLCYGCKETIANSILNEKKYHKHMALPLAPWERRKELGYFRAFYETTYEVIFKPSHFFKDYRHTDSFTHGISFTFFSILILLPLLILFDLGNNFVIFPALEQLCDKFPSSSERALRHLDPKYFDPLHQFTSNFLGNILSRFLYIVPALFINTAIVTLGMLMLGIKHARFVKLFRVPSYALFLSLIPPILIVPAIWSLYVNIIGYAKTAPTSYPNSAFSILWFFTFLIVLFLIVFALSMMIAAIGCAI